MRAAFVVVVVLGLSVVVRPAEADVQSFFFHFGDPPVAVPGGTTSFFLDESRPSAPVARVFDQTTAKSTTTTFPTFTSTAFAGGTTLLPIASVRMNLAANQKMRSCASPAAAIFSVAPNGAPTAIGGTTRTEATVVQGSVGGTVGAEVVRVEFPLTDTTLAAGGAFAVATSLTNDCSINRRTFFAYDGESDGSGVRFQCCFTTAAKCAAKKIKVVANTVGKLLSRVASGAGRGEPLDPVEVEEIRALLTKLFGRRDAIGGCQTTNDAAAMLVLIEAFAAEIDAALDPLGPPNRNRCQKAKIAAVGARAKCGLGLEAKAAERAQFLDVDPAKLAKCRAKLAGVFAKEEAKDRCDTTGDLDAVVADVEAFVATVSSRLACPCP